MASAIIHLAIAKEVLKKVKVKRQYDFYLGSIAPDLSKQIGYSKYESHFLKNSSKQNIPNIDLFVTKYHDFKHNSFDLGYFTHLYTDKLWFDKFLSSKNFNNFIKLLDGTIINTTQNEIVSLIYSDYTNLNIDLIDEYNLDLSLFYEEFQKPKTNINEIPVDRLDILINKMGIIIENSKQNNKQYIFDIQEIKLFIKETTEAILKELEKY